MPNDEPKLPSEPPPTQPPQPSEVAGIAIGIFSGGLAGVLSGGLIGRNLPGAGVDRSDGPTAPAAHSPNGAVPVTHRTYEELAREIIELEKQFALPEPDDIIADARWFEKQWGTPNFEPYRGTHIAVFNGAIVGHGWNSLQLQLDVARKFNVHPQRFIVEFIPPRDF